MRVKATMTFAIVAPESDRVILAAIHGEIDFPNLIPAVGQGYGKNPIPDKPGRFGPIVEIEDIAWEANLGIWTGLVKLKSMIIVLEKGETGSLTSYQNIIMTTFLPGFRIVPDNDQSAAFDTLLEIPVEERLRKYLTT